jgi:hypothetical protein
MQAGHGIRPGEVKGFKWLSLPVDVDPANAPSSIESAIVAYFPPAKGAAAVVKHCDLISHAVSVSKPVYSSR